MCVCVGGWGCFGGLHLSPLSLTAVPPFNHLYSASIPLFVDAVTVTTD